MGPLTATRSYTAAMPNIEQITVAAIDESVSDRYSKIICQAIVCSPPGTPSREKLPSIEQAFEDSHASGLLIEHFAVTPSTIEEYSGRKSRSPRFNTQAVGLAAGFNWLMLKAQYELKQAGHPRIGLLYFDGGAPYWLDWWKVPNKFGIEVVYAPKDGSHKYSPQLDPFGKGLLTLADGIAGKLMKEESNRLESKSRRFSD